MLVAKLSLEYTAKSSISMHWELSTIGVLWKCTMYITQYFIWYTNVGSTKLLKGNN